MTAARLVTLTGLRLPADAPVLRDHVRPEAARDAEYHDRYDRRTVFYDAVRTGTGERVVLTAPPFWNLWPMVRAGLRRDGQPLRRVTRQRHEKSEQLVLSLPRDSRLSLWIGDTDHPIAPRPSEAAAFAGLNVLATVAKDEPFDWIADWFAYHRSAHGAEAAVIVDNGSTAYAAADLAAHLAGLPGMAAALVYSAPFPYGPTGGRVKGERNPLFFQTAMLDLMRRDALAEARAVLGIDIDELVWSRSGRSVFDAAARFRHGMVKIHGEWVYPAPADPLPAPQRRHVFRAVPPRKTAQKWCAVPSGLLSRFGWSPHHVGGDLVKLVPRSEDFRLLHCRGTSRGWKSGRFDRPETAESPDLAALMARHLPEGGA